MRKYVYLAAVASSALLATPLVTTAAFADTGAVLSYGAVGGQNVAVGDTVTASLASGTSVTFYSSTTGTTGVACSSSSFSSTATSNPSAPGVATESLNSQTFGGCSSNVFGTTSVQSVSLSNLPYQVSVDGSTNAVTIGAGSAGAIQSTVVIGTLFGNITCVYQPTSGTISGTAANADNSITFTGQQFAKTSGSSLCLSTAYFTAKYSPVTDTSQGGAAVYVNSQAPSPSPSASATDTASPSPTDSPTPTDTASPSPSSSATAGPSTGAVLTYGSVGGTNVAVGDAVTASLAGTTAATFYSDTTGSTGVSCTSSSFSSTVASNPTAAGVATETLDSQTFGGCTSNVFGTTGVQSVSLSNLPYQVSVDDGTNAVTISAGSAGAIQSTVVLSTLFGDITCVYQPASGTISGTAANADNSITFTNQPFTQVSGSSLCLSTAYFSATYSPVTDTTQGASVFVN